MEIENEALFEEFSFDSPQKQKIKHQAEFEKWINEKYNKVGSIDNDQKEKKNTTYVMRQAEYEQIKDVLNGVITLTDANKRFQFKQKQYSLVDGRIFQRKEITTNRKLNQKIIESKRVAYLEEFFEIIYDAHCVKCMHQGITKTYEFIQAHYTGVPKVAVAAFRKFCFFCELNIKKQTQSHFLSDISIISAQKANGLGNY